MAKGRFGDGISWRAERAHEQAKKDLLVLRLRAATLRLTTMRIASLLRKANFDPNQPRVPRGEPGGGRWTDGGGSAGPTIKRPAGEPVRLAQARGGQGRAVPTLRLPSGIVELSPAQAIRYEAARIRAENEVARLRAVPGNENWRPPAGLYSTVEGAIRQQEAISEAAIAHRYGQTAWLGRSLPRGQIGDNSGDPRPLPDTPIQPMRRGDTEPFTPGTLRTFAPNGEPLGSRFGRAGQNVYTLEPDAFDTLLTNVLRGSVPLRSTPQSYVDKGYWIELADRCVVGLRWSKDNGPTLEIIRSANEDFLKENTKFHRSQ